MRRVRNVLILPLLPSYVNPPNRAQNELKRVREAFIDYFLYDNVYNTSAEFWYDYFYAFSYAAALERGR